MGFRRTCKLPMPSDGESVEPGGQIIHKVIHSGIHCSIHRTRPAQIPRETSTVQVTAPAMVRPTDGGSHDRWNPGVHSTPAQPLAGYWTARAACTRAIGDSQQPATCPGSQGWNLNIAGILPNSRVAPHGGYTARISSEISEPLTAACFRNPTSRNPELRDSEASSSRRYYEMRIS